jgi:signal transduction histidine kinase
MYGICLRGLGSIYKKINDFKTATSYYHIALEVFFDLNYLAGQLSCYNSLGSLARKIKEYSSGINNYRKGYYISLALKKPIQTSKFLINIANVFNETKQYDSARYYYSKAFNIATDYNSVKQQGIILENWGELSYRDEKYHLAEQQLNKAYIIYSGLKYEKGVINILTLQAKVYLSTNRIALASRKIQQSLAMLKETNYPESLLMALETQRDINAKKADFRAAFGTQLRLDSLKDALHEKQKAEAVVNANIKFQTKLTQEQNEKLKVENLANTLKIENLRKKLLIVLLSSLLTIIILVFWYIHSINKKKHAILLKEAEAQRNIRKLKDNISSDLHDVIGGEIFGVLLKYQLLEETGEDSPFKLSDMNAEFSEVYEKIRKYSRKLRKVDRKSITFAESILNLVNDFEASTKSKIETNVSEYDWSSLKDETKEHLYYSIQECVQNAVKYSEAEFIKIHFNKRRNTTQIQIIDNGVGFDTEHIVDSNGLINVQERVNEINGTLTINSKINKGTEIKISIEEKK